MRVVKAVGIVVLLVLSVAAFAGATGASADIMCKQNENPCAVGNRYAEQAVLNFTGGKGVEAKEPALLKAEGVKLTRGGESSKLFCPETVTEKATFEETEPKTGVWESKEP